jgi:hypothetical protein
MATERSSKSVRRHYGRPPSVIRILAEALDRTEGGIHQELHGPDAARLKMLRIIRTAQDAGAHAWVRRYVQPLLDILRDTPAPPLELPVICRASNADAREDASQAIAQATDELPDLERWYRDALVEQAEQGQLIAALGAEIASRKGSLA